MGPSAPELRSVDRAADQRHDERTADDRAEFTALFEAHWSKVHAYARRRTANDDHAHDVAAETFTIAWRRLADIPADHALPWLYRTAGNVLANTARSGRRSNRLADRIASQPAVRFPSVDDTVIEDQALRAAFAALGEDQRELLRLVAWEGLDNREIAEVLGISSGAVANRVSRARARFEEALATADRETGHEPSDDARRPS